MMLMVIHLFRYISKLQLQGFWMEAFMRLHLARGSIGTSNWRLQITDLFKIVHIYKTEYRS